MTKSAFHELGLADGDELVVKSRLMRFLAEEIRKRALTQKAAGKLLGLDQSNISALVHGKISRFSIEKLMTLAGRLGFAVTIHIDGGGVADSWVCHKNGTTPSIATAYLQAAAVRCLRTSELAGRTMYPVAKSPSSMDASRGRSRQ
ncbi:MAG: helix-turn-helix domain-containing protein [Dongiaceae bacterium]